MLMLFAISWPRFFPSVPESTRHPGNRDTSWPFFGQSPEHFTGKLATRCCKFIDKTWGLSRVCQKKHGESCLFFKDRIGDKIKHFNYNMFTPKKRLEGFRPQCLATYACVCFFNWGGSSARSPPRICSTSQWIQVRSVNELVVKLLRWYRTATVS